MRIAFSSLCAEQNFFRWADIYTSMDAQRQTAQHWRPQMKKIWSAPF